MAETPWSRLNRAIPPARRPVPNGAVSSSVRLRQPTSRWGALFSLADETSSRAQASRNADRMHPIVHHQKDKSPAELGFFGSLKR